MNGIGGWFRQLGYKMRYGLQRFMMGRYGQHDKLNVWILWFGVGIVILSMLLPSGVLTVVLPLLSYMLLGIAIWRMLSKDTYKRARENRRFLALLSRIKDQMRVPKGKGKIAITCPKCREKFVKKT